MVCCDAKAIDVGYIAFTFILDGSLHNGRKVDHSRIAQVRLPQSGRENEVSIVFPINSSNRDTGVFVHYDIPKEGKYYIILALCDPTTTNLEISGESLVVNPYGHIPASLYRSIPFYAFLLFFYSGLFVVWLLRCMKYSDELMNIHYFILVPSYLHFSHRSQSFCLLLITLSLLPT